MSKAMYQYVTSTVLDAPIDKVWMVVRDILKVVKIVIGDGAQAVHWSKGASVDHVPAMFQFKLADGTLIHEEVTARSDTDHSITYRAHGVVLYMDSYTATIRLQPVTLPGDQTFVTYERLFSFVPDADANEAYGVITGIMQSEMVALQQYFASSSSVSGK